MRLRWAIAILVACVACGDDGGSGTPSDAPAGPACTGAAFDPCTSNTQCMSNNCRLFMGDGLQVCVVMCTPGNNATCPTDKSGANATCNNMSICKPVGANNCTR